MNTTTKAKQPEQPAPTDTVAILQNLRRGAVLGDIHDALRTVTQHVRQTRKKGVVTIKLTIQPNAKGDSEMLRIEDEVQMKLPQAERGSSIFFADDDGNLSRNPINQAEFAFDVVRGGKDAPAEAAKPAATGTANG